MQALATTSHATISIWTTIQAQCHQVPDDSQPQTHMSKLPKKIMVIIAALVVLVIASLGMVLTKNISTPAEQAATNNQATTPRTTDLKPVEQVFISPTDGTKTQIDTSSYYAVSVGNDQYFGSVSKINNEYIRLMPTGL